MAQSVEWTKMKQALTAIVIPSLRAASFKGSFPHFRRDSTDKVDIVSFLSHSQFGGAFEVGASIVFPNAQNPIETNLYNPDSNRSFNKLIWGDGNIRHGLQGTYDGAFFYADTYRRKAEYTDAYHYQALTPKNEKYLRDHLIANHYELILKVDENIYQDVAHEVLNQMNELLLWFDEMKTYSDLLSWSR